MKPQNDDKTNSNRRIASGLFLLILLQFQCTGTAHYLDQSQWPTVVGLSKPCIQHATTLSRCQLLAGESWGRRSARGDRGVRTGSARSSVCGRNNPCGERAASRRDASECRSGSVTTLSRSQLLIGKTCVTVKSEPFRKNRDQSVGQKGSSGRLDQGALRPEAAWRQCIYQTASAGSPRERKRSGKRCA